MSALNIPPRTSRFGCLPGPPIAPLLAHPTTGLLGCAKLALDHIVSNIAQSLQMATAITQDATKATHMVLLIHGLWGNPKHLKNLYNTLATEYKDEGLYIFLPSSNKDNHTYDGIEVGAERITNEFEANLEELHVAGANISKISIAGYSLGGLLAR